MGWRFGGGGRTRGHAVVVGAEGVIERLKGCCVGEEMGAVRWLLLVTGLLGLGEGNVLMKTTLGKVFPRKNSRRPETSRRSPPKKMFTPLSFVSSAPIIGSEEAYTVAACPVAPRQPMSSIDRGESATVNPTIALYTVRFVPQTRGRIRTKV